MENEKIEEKEEVASASEDVLEETPAETEEEPKTEDDFDYKAEFEKLKTDTEKKDYTWEKLRKENKELQTKLEELGEKDFEGGDGDVKSLIQKELGSLRQELLGDKVEKEIESLSDNVYAQKLVKFNLEKYPGMSVKEAWALANSGKFDLKMKEVKKSLDAKGRKGDGSGAGQKASKSTEPQISSDNMQIIQRMGLKWDGDKFSKKDGRFALKPLPNGEFEQINLK